MRKYELGKTIVKTGNIHIFFILTMAILGGFSVLSGGALAAGACYTSGGHPVGGDVIVSSYEIWSGDCDFNSVTVNSGGTISTAGNDSSLNVTQYVNVAGVIAAGANRLNISAQNLTVVSGGKISANGGSEQNGGTLTINASFIEIDNSGTISAVGGIGCNGKTGGTLTFNAGNINLSAAGIISANGGNAGCYFSTAGSGGAVYINTVDQFMPSGSITAVAGSGYYAGRSGVIYLNSGGDRVSDSLDIYGNNPTINPVPWLVDSMNGGCGDNTDCTIYGVKTNLVGTRSFENLNVTGAEVYPISNPVLSTIGTILISNSALVHVGTSSLNVLTQNLTVKAGGKLSADGGSEQNGGTITINASSLDISGTISAIGGNAQTSCSAAKSGGRITINASTINHSAAGIVSANGGSPYCSLRNGGNGGTVSITTPNPFSPAGTITAAGGVANPPSYPSGANGMIQLDFGGDRISDSVDLYTNNPTINPSPWLVDSMNGGCSDNTNCVIYGVKTNLYGTHSFESLNATKSEVHIKSTPTLSVPGILLIDSSSTVYIDTNSLNISAPSMLIGAGSTLQAGTNSLNIATPNLTVRTGGKISADGGSEQNGGTITVNASSVDISGTVSAVGGNGKDSCSAGKSGGRITINASTINHSASGIVSANGGSPYCSLRNGGNGGTVSITTPNPFSPAGTITATGGIANPPHYPSGANGMVYLDFGGDRVSDSTDLYIGNPTINPIPWLVDSMNGGCSDNTSCVIYGVKTNLYGNRSFENLNITNSEVHIKSTPMFSIPGILLVDSNSTIYVDTSSLNISAPSVLIGAGSTLQTGTNSLNIATQNLTIRTSGKISADGGSEQNGGTITVNASSVDISGTISAVGGNGQNSCSNGKSGGRITINASTINHSAAGVVSANGGTPYCALKNGGNGGTVTITVINPFSPTGTITATGGIANPPSYPSGAPGTITINYCTTCDLSGATINPAPILNRFKCEDIPPTITISLSGTLGTNGWYTSNVQVTLTATDNEGGTGVNYTEYSLDGTNWSTYTGAPFLIADEGITTVYYRSADKADNIEETKNQTIKIDKSKPQIQINSPINNSEYTFAQTVIADWSASDAVSGIASASGTIPSGQPVNTTSLGENTFRVDATDNAGLQENQTITYHVRYNYSGILDPINANGSSIFNSNKNSIVPVKFQLFDASGGFVTGAIAEINLTLIDSNVTGPINENVVVGKATAGNHFVYDRKTNEYVFNIATWELSEGTWGIEIRLDDGTSKYVNISVKKENV